MLGRVTQWLECLPYKEEVRGSNPFTPTQQMTPIREMAPIHVKLPMPSSVQEMLRTITSILRGIVGWEIRLQQLP